MNKENIQPVNTRALPNKLRTATDFMQWENELASRYEYSNFGDRDATLRDMKIYLTDKPEIFAFLSEEEVIKNEELTVPQKQQILSRMRSPYSNDKGRLLRLTVDDQEGELRLTQSIIEAGEKCVLVWTPPGMRTSGEPYTEKTSLGLPELPAQCSASPTGRCSFASDGRTMQCMFCEKTCTIREAYELSGGYIPPRPSEASNRLMNPEEALLWKEVVGEERYEAVLKALAAKGDVWVFYSEEEIVNNKELTSEERENVLKAFRESTRQYYSTRGPQQGWYAGLIRLGPEQRAQVEKARVEWPNLGFADVLGEGYFPGEWRNDYKNNEEAVREIERRRRERAGVTVDSGPGYTEFRC